MVDFPYSPGYSFENALLTDEGLLVMKDGGGSLYSEYPSVPGIWDYTVYYDMPDTEGDALIEVEAGDGRPVRVKPDPASDIAKIEGVVMTGGKTVSFCMNAPEGTKIKRIEIRRKGEAP